MYPCHSGALNDLNKQNVVNIWKIFKWLTYLKFLSSRSAIRSVTGRSVQSMVSRSCFNCSILGFGERRRFRQTIIESNRVLSSTRQVFFRTSQKSSTSSMPNCSCSTSHFKFCAENARHASRRRLFWYSFTWSHVSLIVCLFKLIRHELTKAQSLTSSLGIQRHPC